MSGTDAVSAATKTLIKLLEKRMDTPPDTIYGAPPDVRLGDPPGPKRLNLFLYRVEENPFLRNQDLDALPGRRGHPPLSLDLHYLLTAYGSNEEDTEGAHQILGDAVRVLHDHPVIHAGDDAYDDVRDPALDGAFEAVKITMEPVSTEDLTKVWTALTAPYRLSASYVVNVVQIESRRGGVPAPLVRDGTRAPGDTEAVNDPDDPAHEGRRIQVVALEPPGLESVMVLRGAEKDDDPPHVAYAAIGDRLVLRGRNLGRPPGDGSPDPTTVHVGPVEITPAADRHEPDRIIVPIPDHADLVPDQYPVRVTVALGGGRSISSNRLPMLVVPFVAKAEEKTVHVLPGSGNPGPPAQPPGLGKQAVVITGTRLFVEGLPGRVILSRDATPGTEGKVVVDATADDYLRNYKHHPPTGDTVDPADGEIAVALPDGEDGTGLRVRVLVDGHENLPRPDLLVTGGG